MELEPKVSPQKSHSPKQFAEPFSEPPERKPLVLLRDTERSLRRMTIGTLTPILPEKLAEDLGEASLLADESLNQLAEIDLSKISEAELQPARIKIGLVFVGFGALMMVFLLLYLDTLHPELDSAQQIQRYWYQYIWFVCIGVAGMFMLGREAMRPPVQPDDDRDPFEP